LLLSDICSILFRVSQDRPGPDRDRLITAQLFGAAQRHAGWHELADPEMADAVAELEEIIADRDDGPALLAEVAGILIGAHEGALDEPRARGAAQLCIAAGADPAAIPAWVEEGRRRRANAKRPPFSGGLRP
jgi:hypothetical protein